MQDTQDTPQSYQNENMTPSNGTPHLSPDVRRALFSDPNLDADNKGDHDDEILDDDSFPDPGQQLLTGNEEYFPDSQKKLGQLEVVPMTLIPAEVIPFQHGNIITANSYYLCYAIKGTMIRVIGLKAPTRGLIRLEKTINDIAFCPANNNLACVDSDGVSVWRLVDQDGKTIPQLLFKAIDTTKTRVFSRLKWHPTDLNLLALSDVSSNPGQPSNFYLLRVGGAVRAFKEESLSFSDLSDSMTISTVEGKITDLSFSATQPTIAVASTSGIISLFPTENVLSSPVQWAPHPNDLGLGPVFATLFCPGEASHLLVTAGSNGHEIKLWDTNSGVCLQTISFLPKGAESQPGVHFAFDQTGSFLFVADSNRDSFCILHLKNQLRSPRFDYLSEFELVYTHDNKQSRGSTSSVSIKSFIVVNDKTQMNVYTHQSAMCQMYKVTSEKCYKPYKDGSPGGESPVLPATADEQLPQAPVPTEAEPSPPGLGPEIVVPSIEEPQQVPEVEPAYQEVPSSDEVPAEPNQESQLESQEPSPDTEPVVVITEAPTEEQTVDVQEQAPAKLEPVPPSPAKEEKKRPSKKKNRSKKNQKEAHSSDQSPNTPLPIPTSAVVQQQPSPPVLPPATILGPPMVLPASADLHSSGLIDRDAISIPSNSSLEFDEEALLSSIATLLEQQRHTIMHQIHQQALQREEERKQIFVQFLQNQLPSQLQNHIIKILFPAVISSVLGSVPSAMEKSSLPDNVQLPSLVKPVCDAFAQQTIETLVPAFENSSRDMFERLLGSFDQSTNRQTQDFGRSLAKTIQPNKQLVIETTNSLAGLNGITYAIQSLNQISAHLNNSILETQAIMTQNVAKWEKRGHHQPHIKFSLEQLVEQQQYEKAFSVAFASQDTSLVDWLLSCIHPDDLGNATSQFPQSRIVSLLRHMTVHSDFGNSQQLIDWLSFLLLELELDTEEDLHAVLPLLLTKLEGIENAEFQQATRMLARNVKRVIGKLGAK